MLTWFKNIFGITPKRETALVLENPILEEITAKTESKSTVKKSITKKASAKTTEAPKKRGRKPKNSN